jgi:hypothetical protein
VEELELLVELEVSIFMLFVLLVEVAGDLSFEFLLASRKPPPAITIMTTIIAATTDLFMFSPPKVYDYT